MTDPIIPAEYYDFCTQHADDASAAFSVLNKIPAVNRRVLEFLVHFLQIICHPDNQAATRMSINNIAMVFAPNILRCPSDNLQLVLENTKYEQVRFLIISIVS